MKAIWIRQMDKTKRTVLKAYLLFSRILEHLMSL